MADKDLMVNEQEQVVSAEEQQIPTVSGQPTVKELMTYINMVRADIYTVEKALSTLNDIPACSGESLRFQAIADVIRCRETTNQKILSIYENMYDDLMGKPRGQVAREEIRQSNISALEMMIDHIKDTEGEINGDKIESIMKLI